MPRFLIVITCLFVICRSAIYAKEQPKPLEYYSLCNKAELYIAKRDLTSAFSNYNKAFSINYQKPFSRDVYNAFHCAMDLKKYSEAENFLKILLVRGLTSAQINKYIQGFYKGDELRIIQSTILSSVNDTLHVSKLNNEIRKLIQLDQSVRNHFDKKNNGKYMTDSTYKVDQYCSKNLMSIFSKLERLPNITDLGHDKNFFLNGLNYSVIIIHNGSAYMNKMPCDMFDTILYKSIFTYDYHPKWMARDLNQISYSHQNRKLIFHNQYVIFPLIIGRNEDLPFFLDTKLSIDKKIRYQNEKKIVDENRKKIGLETLDELWLKQDFMKEEKGLAYGKYILD